MTEELPFCECGECGLRVTKPGNRFINGHNRRGIPHTPKTCAKISKILENSEAVKAYAEARRGVPNSPEHNAAISKAKTDIPNSPEHNAAISVGRKNSDAVKDAVEARKGVPLSPEHIAAIKKGQEEAGVYDVMRGGNDFVWHHVAYDFNDPEALRVRIKRKFHGAIHNPKGCKFSKRCYSLID